jgi:hypothetical protein
MFLPLPNLTINSSHSCNLYQGSHATALEKVTMQTNSLLKDSTRSSRHLHGSPLSEFAVGERNEQMLEGELEGEIDISALKTD